MLNAKKLKIKLVIVASMFSCLFLAACTNTHNQRLTSYSINKPAFSMIQFFAGDLCAKGLVRDRSKSVTRKFVATIDAQFINNVLTLDEKFVFDDGEKQSRLWRFKQNNESWTGTAGDVVGQAQGQEVGDSLYLTYQLKVKLDDSEYIIAMDDWLHLIDQNTLIGSTDMTKWGFNVGQIDIVITKDQCH
jgi:hypothetical protein